jgi:hypothetical protein
VGTLEHAVTDRSLRAPLVGVVTGTGEFDLRKPPPGMHLESALFLRAIECGLRSWNACAVGVVLPVRSVDGEDLVCDYLDAEAVVLVAVEDLDGGVGSVGLRCALHELPDGWTEAHEKLQWIARPLRLALAGRELEDQEAV